MQHVDPTFFHSANKQAISLLDITAPARLVEPSLAEKVQAAVAVVKGLLRARKHLVAASSFGKDSSVMVALALRAMEELQAREFGFSDFQIQQVRTRLGIPRHVLDRSEMDAMLGTVTDLAIGSTLGIAQPVVSKLRRDRGIPATRDALNWTAELQALLPLLSDEAMAGRAGCGLVQIQAIRRGEQVLTNKTPLREIASLLGVWSDEDLAAQHGGTPARYASARQRRGIALRRRAPEAHADSVR